MAHPVIPILEERHVRRQIARSAASTAKAREPGTLAALPPLSLYIHIPWCVRKCPYCDFNSHEVAPDATGLPEAEYVAALRADLESVLPLVWGRRVHAVFIGGGTPSLFSPMAIDEILVMARSLLPIEPDAEITLEANPGTVETGRFAGFAAAGVNRISIGVQSFGDAFLGRLGRIHDSTQARRAIDAALMHFDRVNIDLMYGLPEQTLVDLAADLKVALSTGVVHQSWYNLTLEPNTLFAAHPPALPDDDGLADMEDLVQRQLAAAGLDRYEISAYAAAGQRCRHNLNYWHYGDYIGIGAGAHAKLSFADRIVRYARYKHPRVYMERARTGAAVEIEHPVELADRPFEFMLNALRLVGGVRASLFEERTGLGLSVIADVIASASHRGLLEVSGDVLRPTALGLRFLNDLQESFLPTNALK